MGLGVEQPRVVQADTYLQCNKLVLSFLTRLGRRRIVVSPSGKQIPTPTEHPICVRLNRPHPHVILVELSGRRISIPIDYLICVQRSWPIWNWIVIGLSGGPMPTFIEYLVCVYVIQPDQHRVLPFQSGRQIYTLSEYLECVFFELQPNIPGISIGQSCGPIPTFTECLVCIRLIRPDGHGILGCLSGRPITTLIEYLACVHVRSIWLDWYWISVELLGEPKPTSN
jgi:hypothetical protein